MKKQYLMVALMAALSVSAFGQGQVTLANNSATLVRFFDPVNGTPIPIGSMTFQLYSGPNEGSLTPLFPTAGTSPAGRIANTAYFIPSAPNGQIAYFQIRLWDSRVASYFEAFSAGFWTGSSEVFQSNTSFQNPGDPPPIPVNLAGKYAPIVIAPEPSTWTLLALGGAALFIGSRAGARKPKSAARTIS